MKCTWTIGGVRDVLGRFKWYRTLFGPPETAPAHDYWGQICGSDGTILCLHRWDSHSHPSLMSEDNVQPGNGLLSFFRVGDFDLALQRTRGLVLRLDQEPHVNPATGTREFALRGP